MKQIQIELSAEAESVLNKMSRLGKVKPEAIARVCVENSLSQAIDRLNAEDGDLWFMVSAQDPEATCRESWNAVEKPGSYASALKR